jgi:hypothetical protein
MVRIAHHPGRHCASTGLCNLVNFHSIRWSEAMCFGLGAGLGIWYLDLAGISPSRLVHVRSSDIEEQFFRRIGYPFAWEVFEEPYESEQALRALLDRGLPAIVRTDIYYLPYYNSGTHFPGHVITVWGYDEDKEIFVVTDTERTDALEVAFEDMRRSRYNKDGFFEMQGNMFAPESLSLPDDFPKAIREAIVFNSSVILDNSNYFQGIAGLEKWQKEIEHWGDLDDWQWAARFTYQVIEKRGTGGGGFRFMYADFLKEAQSYEPQISSLGLAEQMREVGLAWQDLAYSLKTASEENKPDFSEAAKKLQVVARKEAAYHQDTKNLA